MNELLKLKAELVTDAGTYNLTPAASTRDIKKKSFIATWISEVVPSTNGPIEFRIYLSSGDKLFRMLIPSSAPEFAHPLFRDEGTLRKYIEALLESFLEGHRSARDTLELLHQLSEDDDARRVLTPFELIY
jgi:hypothetical protein